MPFVPIKWKQPYPGAIPFTFPPKPPKKKFNVDELDFPHCHAYRDKMVCNKKDCSYPHYTMAEVEEIVQRVSQSTHREAVRRKSNRKNRTRFFGGITIILTAGASNRGKQERQASAKGNGQRGEIDGTMGGEIDGSMGGEVDGSMDLPGTNAASEQHDPMEISS